MPLSPFAENLSPELQPEKTLESFVRPFLEYLTPHPAKPTLCVSPHSQHPCLPPQLTVAPE